MIHGDLKYNQCYELYMFQTFQHFGVVFLNNVCRLRGKRARGGREAGDVCQVVRVYNLRREMMKRRERTVSDYRRKRGARTVLNGETPEANIRLIVCLSSTDAFK